MHVERTDRKTVDRCRRPSQITKEDDRSAGNGRRHDGNAAADNHHRHRRPNPQSFKANGLAKTEPAAIVPQGATNVTQPAANPIQQASHQVTEARESTNDSAEAERIRRLESMVEKAVASNNRQCARKPGPTSTIANRLRTLIADVGPGSIEPKLRCQPRQTVNPKT